MGCCSSQFEALRASEARLLNCIAGKLHGKGSVLRRDLLVKLSEDPVVSQGIVHFIELQPQGMNSRQQGEVLAEEMRVEGWPMNSDTAEDELLLEPDTATEKPPLVMLPGFGMGAASFTPCIEHFLVRFPERRIFILDWPASGAAPRMPWTVEAKSKFLTESQRFSSKAPVHNGVVCMQDSLSEAKQPSYPLPEDRFVEVIEQWRRALGIPEMILLGHSIGGFIAFGYAEKYPSHVHRLLLCSPCGVPQRPDALGISEGSYREWSERKAREEPEFANEFMRGSAVKWPKLTCSDFALLSVVLVFCTALSPVLCFLALLCSLRARTCGKSSVEHFEETHPQNGMPRDFRCSWAPMENLSSDNYERLYETKAVPPTVRVRSFPSCIGQRGMQLFAEMRFQDTGQWAESLNGEPGESSCIVISGHEDNMERTVDDTSKSTDVAQIPAGSSECVKISRAAFADYQYHITAFGNGALNWGEQLFSSLQFHRSYGSFGWTRRPIGRRIEQFLGLPKNFDGGSEFYSSNNSTAPALESAETVGDLEHAGNIPVCFFYGKNDWMPFRAAKLISEKVARYSGKTVPVLLLKSSGHQMFVDNPKGFVEGVRMLVPRQGNAAWTTRNEHQRQ